MASGERRAVQSQVEASAVSGGVGSASGGSGAGKMVYYFGPSGCDGDESMKESLGGKGANLAEMTRSGLPVPPGFTITTETCAAYNEGGRRFPAGLEESIDEHLERLEGDTGKRFFDDADPLLVSVRSGAARSMPGMMDTILNLGLNDKATDALAGAMHDARFAYDAYRRLIHMFGNVVMGVDNALFEHAFEDLKRSYSVVQDTDVPTNGIAELVERYKKVYRDAVGGEFPQEAREQLTLAIRAVFDSWNSPRAKSYRRLSNITGLKGTAVNVQAMVFGNYGNDSGTGVAFTRNPATGENAFYGEFLVNAQGEDVVAGIRTPRSISELASWDKDAYERLLEIKDTLEGHYKDVQDIEFTIERGRLFILQTRTAKRTGVAAVRTACEMVDEGLIDETEAVRRVPARDVIQLLLPSFSVASKEGADVIAEGLPASPGAAVGKPAFTADEAVDRKQTGERVILVRHETSPEDVEGMHSAEGILTSTGGMTSHAAVVARGWGKCCVAGAGEISIDEGRGEFRVGDRVFGREDVISIDGNTGEVMAGEVAAPSPEMGEDFERLMGWADAKRRLGVRTNADTPEDAARARRFGAQGIGLCRTEHMFFEGERITAMRRMILAEKSRDREAALERLLPYQREDFAGIFRAMDGLPVTVRLLDPPLHEFLPHEPAAIRECAENQGVSEEFVRHRVTELSEANPMLGHRGCRLAVSYPEILRMQVRAIVEAAIACCGEGVDARPEIMIPLVGVKAELSLLREEALGVIESVRSENEGKACPEIPIGTMIEVPRAALVAGSIAEEADFFSFGTNDLTQLTFGYSRDDINEFLPDYLRRDLLPRDPFQSIDEEGVGALVRLGVEGGRSAKAGLHIGICGEHGGDPDSVRFCHDLGMDYVSCSPFRVPIARLAAAQAALDR